LCCISSTKIGNSIQSGNNDLGFEQIQRKNAGHQILSTVLPPFVPFAIFVAIATITPNSAIKAISSKQKLSFVRVKKVLDLLQ
jgi:hypothetical protein